jgi:energy-coupling factor transporter ATP-binding protein EcfA2
LAHDPHDEAHIGFRSVYGGTQRFGLSRLDRRQHLLVIGKSGVGKSTLLANLMLSHIAAGQGVAVIDPHGDLAGDLLDRVPPFRSRDVIVFQPSDIEYPMAYNILKTKRNTRSIPLVVSSIVSAFKHSFSHSWGPRLEHFLWHTLAALAECENATILGVPRMLLDEGYRAWVLRQVRDPGVRSFWEKEFASYDRRFIAEASGPIFNKIGSLISTPMIRNIFGQVRKAFNLREIMDDGKIFIADLSKGKLGEDKANLLGSLLVSEFQSAAMSRADTTEAQRPDSSLFVDEYANFTTDSFASAMAECRKYHLSLVLSQQHLSQTRPEVREAVLGNVGSIIAFRTGELDAHVLHREFGGAFTARQFTDLPNHEVFVKILENGHQLDPFHATTLPPQGTFFGRRDVLIRQSRQRYATPRQIVEDRINRFIGIDLPPDRHR